MISGYIETFRAVVYPWHCDHQGHMTVMHYVGMFDAAFWHQLSALGFTRAYMAAEKCGFADVRDTLEYRAELPVGSLVVIDSGLLEGRLHLRRRLPPHEERGDRRDRRHLRKGHGLFRPGSAGEEADPGRVQACAWRRRLWSGRVDLTPRRRRPLVELSRWTVKPLIFQLRLILTVTL